MSLNTELSKLINFIKISIQNRNFIIEYKKSQLLLDISKCLLRLQLINGFFEKNNKLYIIFKYNTLGENLIKDIKMEYKRPFEKIFKLKYLQSKTFNKKYILKEGSKNSFFLLTTTKGILTHQEAIKNKVGGKVLLLLKSY